MENQAVDTLTLGGSASYDLTVWGLFFEADIIVKIVLILLLFASFWTWAIIFEKVLRMRRLKSSAGEFEEAFWSGGSLEDLYDEIDDQPPDPMSSLFVSAMREWRRSASRGAGGSGETPKAGLQQRIERVMQITMGREMDRLEKHMVFLASVGSAAPFVGLFGTVWGIMNAFTSIAASENTSLVVVAPGIAEALFATALGLVAAIPAVIGFNKLSNDLGRYAGRLDAFAGEFGAILSRQLDERA
jgi:biopolymer transport protein TolQ